MVVSIESFTIISSTAGVVSWLPLDVIHHNDEMVNYTIRLTNLNQSEETDTFNTQDTTFNITGSAFLVDNTFVLSTPSHSLNFFLILFKIWSHSQTTEHKLQL